MVFREVTSTQIPTLSHGGGGKKLVLRGVLGPRGYLALAGIHQRARPRLLPQIQHRVIRISHATVGSKEHLIERVTSTSAARRAPILKRQSQRWKQQPTSPCSIPSTRPQKLFLVFFFKRGSNLCAEPRLTSGGENSPHDSAEAHQELPEGHVLLGDRHRQRAGVVLHKDARDAVAARRVVDHPLLGTPAGRRLSVGLGLGLRES